MLKKDLKFKFSMIAVGFSFIILADLRVTKELAVPTLAEERVQNDNRTINLTYYKDTNKQLPIITKEWKDDPTLIKSEPVVKKTNLVKSKIDKSYSGSSVKLTSYNRNLLERLVTGESKGEGLIGQMLVAQCLRDTMLLYDIYDVEKIIRQFKYSGSISEEPTASVKEAVSRIFDDGDYAVQHRLIYFYAPKGVEGGISTFHENQLHILTYKGHKFFDEIRP